MGQQDKITWNGNSSIFKTYVKGKGKRPVEKVKDRDRINTFEEVCNSDSFGGILNPDYIDISFDSKDMWDHFLDMAEANDWRCLCLPSTKGGHSYWKKLWVTTGNPVYLASYLVNLSPRVIYGLKAINTRLVFRPQRGF